MAIWDEYQQNQYSGQASDAAKAAASAGGSKPTVTTSGNDAWKQAQSGPPQSNFPAANDFMAGNASGQMTSLGSQFQPQPIPQSNDYRPGSIGNNIGIGLGQSFQNPYATMFNPPQQQQQPTLTGYHWSKGTGGVSGGNDAGAIVNWSDGSTENMLGGVKDFQLGMTKQVPQPQYPQAPSQYPVTPEGNINYNVPGGSMQDALQKLGSTGNNYNSSTGRWLGY